MKQQIMAEREDPKIISTPKNIVLEKIRDILYLSGVPEEKWPTQGARTIMLEFIYNVFGNLITPNELLIAYQLMITGVLDWESDKFERFGMIMITKMLKSYQRYRFDVYKEMTPQLEKHIPTELETTQEMIRLIIEAFEKYKITKKLIDFGNVKYQFLVDRGLIALTDGRRKEIYKNIWTSSHFLEFSKGFSAEKKKDCAKILSREFVLKDYFDHLIEMNEDINLILQS